MSKIKKKNLARGTKLSTQQVWDNNLDGVVTNINRAEESDGLIQPMYEAGEGTFRLNFNIPWIGSEWTKHNGPNNIHADKDKPYIIPFCLLPLQNFITSDGTTNDDTPTISLMEFSYGFDQRAEPAFITDQQCGPGSGTNETWSEYIRDLGAFPAANATPLDIPTLEYKLFFSNQNQGKLDFNEFLARGDFKFSLLKKDMQYFNTYATSQPEDSVWEYTAPITGFTSRTQRLNPFTIKDINVAIDPYSTYCLGIMPPQLHDTDAAGDRVNLAIVNLTLSLKFKGRLVLRDKSPAAGVGDPPNIPEHGGHKVDDTVTVDKPAADDPIYAETVGSGGATIGGLNTTTATIDEVFRKQLNAGYDASSNRPSVEQLAQDSGYEIIAVPLWNNLEQNMFTGRSALVGAGPYSYGMYNSGGRTTSGAGLPGPHEMNQVREGAEIKTRAIIPIDYPFTIHHVVLAANVYTAAFGLATTADDTYMYAHNTHPLPNDAASVTNIVPVRTVHNIGIGIGTGLRGAKYGYKQVLSYTGLDLNKDTFKLDNIRMNYNSTTSTELGGNNDALTKPGTAPGNATVPQPDYEWRTFYLPINGVPAASAQVSPGLYNQAGTAATPGTYTAMQNPPTFAGNSFVIRDDSQGVNAPGIRACAGTSVRLNDPNNLGTANVLSGDQWIEIRWNTYPWDDAGSAIPPLGWKTFADISTAAGTYPQSPWTAIGGSVDLYSAQAHTENKIIHGYGGHWIYLIGKKTTVSDANWQDTDLKGGM